MGSVAQWGNAVNNRLWESVERRFTHWGPVGMSHLKRGDFIVRFVNMANVITAS